MQLLNVETTATPSGYVPQARGSKKVQLPNPLHSSVNDDWGTPDAIIQSAHVWLGGAPDLDPCSSAFHNERVGAKQFFSVEDNGMAQDWSIAKTIFLNPPNGKHVPKGQKPRDWWNKLTAWAKEDASRKAVFVAFSIFHLQSGQGEKWAPSITDYPVVLLKKRPRYIDGRNEKASERPTHPSALVLVGGVGDEVASLSHLGAVMVPYDQPLF